MDVDLRLTVAGLSVSAVSLQTLAEVRADDVPTASVNITAVIPGQTLVYIWVETSIIRFRVTLVSFRHYYSFYFPFSIQVCCVFFVDVIFSSFFWRLY